MEPPEFDTAADEDSSLTRLFELHDECRLRAEHEADPTNNYRLWTQQDVANLRLHIEERKGDSTV